MLKSVVRMAELSQEDPISAAIKLTQQLRASVIHVFESLSNGIPESHQAEGMEKHFLAELKRNLLAVNKDFGSLEKLSASLQPSSGPLTLRNSSLLTLDPVLDKTPLYSQLLQTYKWSNKMSEHATRACILLQQNSLKRSVTSLTPIPGKQPRIRKPLSNYHSTPSTIVDPYMQQLVRHFPDMAITISRPFGSPAVLQLTLGRTLKAIVVLRGFMLEFVNVKAFSEDWYTDSDKLDIWSKSRYRVFRKVTDHSNAAMLHFTRQTRHEFYLRHFMAWFNSYLNLFSSPCQKCGKHLQDNLPPTWRDTRLLTAYHESCRP